MVYGSVEPLLADDTLSQRDSYPAPLSHSGTSEIWTPFKSYTTMKTIFPANAVIISQGASAVPAGLFNANATGRVTPVGEFFGFQDSFEYFFGLTPLPSGSPPNGAITATTIAEFTSGCPEVAASTVYLSVSTINPDNSTGPFLTALKQVAFWRFDDQGAVLQYDAWIPNLDLFAKLSRGYDQYTLAGMNAAIQGICALQDTTCVGNNTVYDGIPDCVQALAAKNYRREDEAGTFRWTVHCAHVGPTGGGKCVDIEYNDGYFNDEFLYGAPLGAPFTCDYGKKKY
ncbi:hypothetical protein K438DRAFT_2025345 [Mycena galopus ATCC 62051]|nr:hypothetical protein K438DRAFT_2025345 [Mycena galopus ATCC 62051]